MLAESVWSAVYYPHPFNDRMPPINYSHQVNGHGKGDCCASKKYCFIPGKGCNRKRETGPAPWSNHESTAERWSGLPT